MTAPVPATRTTPVGTMLEDGYQALINIAADSDISFWEKSVQPPGLDGGDEIDITTMHNTALRTFAARGLYTLTPITCRVAYTPAVVPQIEAVINTNTTVTITFSDGHKVAFFGFLKSFVPDEMEEGTHPEAVVSIVPTNVDPASGDEEGPVTQTAAGTTL